MRAVIALSLFLLICPACGTGDGDGTTPPPDTGPGLDIVATDIAPAPDTGEDIEPEVFVPPRDCDDDEDCDDGNPCTIDSCTAGECAYQDASDACDDGDPCTVNDECGGGACAGTPMSCDDENECTEDKCKDGECVNSWLNTPECTIFVTIYYPARGTTLWDDKVVHVTGNVASQGQTITEANLNDYPITVDGSGDFDAITEAGVGLNILVVKVEDALGRKGRAVRSYLYGEGIRPPGDPDDIEAIAAGSKVWLGQEVFDDDDTGDLDDVATLAWTVLSNYDINQFIPHPLLHEDDGPDFAWCEWEVDVDNILYDVGPLDITTVDGGIALSAVLTNLSAEFSAIASWCPDAIGFIYADEVTIDAVIQVELNESGAFDLELTSVDVNISGISVDIVEGTGAYFDWLVNWFDETISNLIEENLEIWLPESLIPMIDELLTGFTSYDVEIPIPTIPGVSAGTPLSLSVWPSAVNFSDAGLAVDLDIGVAATQLTGHTCPGSILRDDCEGQDPGVFFLPAQDPVEAALAEDLVNQLLFSVWWGGHLNITMTDEILGAIVEKFGMDALVLQVDPHLPPVITTCVAGSGIEIQIGELNLLASFNLAGGSSGEVELYAHLRVKVAPLLTVGSDGLHHVGVEVLGIEELFADIVATDGVVDGLDGLVEELLQVAVVDLLIGDYLSQLMMSYPIPAIDLGAFIPGVPPGSEATFDFLTLEPVLGYWLGGGAIVNP